MNIVEQDSSFQEVRALKKSRRYREALDIVEALLLESYGGPAFFSMASHLYLVVKDYPRAVEMADRCLAFNPRDPWCLRYKGMSLYRLGRKDEAEGIFFDLAADNPDPRTAQGVADFFKSEKEYARALAFLDRSLDRWPGNKELLVVKAEVLRETGREGEAGEILRTVVQEHPDDEFAYRRLIETKLEGREAGEVIEELQSLLSVPSRGKNIFLRELLAQKLYETKQYRRACEQYREVLKLRPDDDFSRKQMCYCLARLEAYDEAIPLFEEVFTKSPDDFYLRSALVKAYEAAGKCLEGMEFFKGVIAKYPRMRSLWGSVRALGKKLSGGCGAEAQEKGADVKERGQQAQDGDGVKERGQQTQGGGAAPAVKAAGRKARGRPAKAAGEAK